MLKMKRPRWKLALPFVVTLGAITLAIFAHSSGGANASGVAAVATGAVRAGPRTKAAGAIAFVSNRAGQSRIYVVNADGTDTRLLVGGAIRLGQDATDVRWSPDGRALAFTGRSGLYVLRIGAGVRRIADGVIRGASWSPDGRRLAFSPAADGVIHVAAADGSNDVPITKGDDIAPEWSPEGKHIAFVRIDANAQRAVWVTDPDGRNQRQVQNDACSDDSAWSPNGKRLAVVVGDYFNNQLAVVGANGVGARILAKGKRVDCFPPAWSPDGRRLAFNGLSPDGTYVVGVDDRALRRIFPGFGSPRWSPDGSAIATSDGQADIWVVKVDGSGKRRLTQAYRYGYEDYAPEWNPRGLRAKELAGVSVSATLPTDSVASGGVLRTRSRIDRISVDGSRVALAYATVPNCIEVWNARTGSLARFPEQSCVSEEQGAEPAGIYELALADTRLAWATYLETNHYDTSVLTATPARPRPAGVFGIEDVGEVGEVRGDGSLIAFVVRLEDSKGNATKGTVYRLSGGRRLKLRTEQGGPRILSVDAGRIAVRSADGSVEVLDASGRLLRSLPVNLPEKSPGAFSGSQLVLQTAKDLALCDVTRGTLRHTFPIAQGGRLEDAQSGLAVFVVGTKVHLLRLRDGREVVIRVPGRGPVHAELEAPGLFYSYRVDDTHFRGRVAFVPVAKLPLR